MRRLRWSGSGCGAAEVIAADKVALAAVEAERAAERAEIAKTDSGEAALSTYDRIAKA